MSRHPSNRPTGDFQPPSPPSGPFNIPPPSQPNPPSSKWLVPIGIGAVAVLVVVATLLTLGGGGGGSSPNEATLRANMNEIWTAFQKNDMAKLYALSLSDEEKSRCSLSEFTGTMLLAQAFLGESIKKAKYEIRDVKIDGNRATFQTALTLDGQPLGNDADVEEAMWNGKRWMSTESSTCGEESGSSPARTPTPRPSVALGQPQTVAPNIRITAIALRKSTCDNGTGISMEGELVNSTAVFYKDLPTVTVSSPDNQRLVQFLGLRESSDAQFTLATSNFLPQGFPPNQTTKFFICFGTATRYVGQVPTSFPGWIIEAGNDARWTVR